MSSLADRMRRRFTSGPSIIVVSGLPRSGTSMAMQMLGAGGVPLLADDVRRPDAQNPEGYFELERVKSLPAGGDTAWLDGARGRAVKIVSHLLTWLPEDYAYKVVFMERNLEEVVASQDAMLAARGEPPQPDATRTARLYAEHLAQVRGFLARRRCFETLTVGYADVIGHPHVQAGRIAAFLGGRLAADAMAAAVKPELYRERRKGDRSR